jgi:hypothetical protein
MWWSAAGHLEGLGERFWVDRYVVGGSSPAILLFADLGPIREMLIEESGDLGVGVEAIL